MHSVNMKRSVKIVLIVLFVLILSLFFIRLINPSEIDDVSPGINCPEIEIYNPSTLYVIPNYNNNPISNDTGWCKHILSLNKTLELHGITHSYREFLYKNITQEDLNYGISEFEKCFNKTPDKFKAPQLDISKENRLLIKENNLKLRTRFNQITRKVYHCNDSDVIPNKIIKIF
jgi:predicted deacetylase